MKKATVLGYSRISNAKQDPSDKKISDPKKKPILLAQFDEIQKGLKAAGLPQVKKENWFAEIQSGTDRDRGQWNSLMARALELAHKGKRVFIAVKDPSRWSRNTRHSMVAIDRMHELGVPVMAVREGIQTGSTGDLHPTEELLFVQLQGGASFVSQEQKKKADDSVELSKEAGVMSAKGTSLFPFARKDPLDAYMEQLPLLSVPTKDGGGSTAFKGTIEGMTQPNGRTASSVGRLMTAEEERRKKLSDKEYQEWYEYRKMIRDILIDLDYDPYATKTNREGKISWKAKALMRMVGRYLQEPWIYSQRSDDEIQKILKSAKEYLGTKDLLRYRQLVGKR
jgi:hypothetical protein